LGNSIVATFADDTAILAVDSSNEKSTGKLQTTIDQKQKWTKKSSLLNRSQFILTLPTDALSTSQ
jgi:hypothetical protein